MSEKHDKCHNFDLPTESTLAPSLHKQTGLPYTRRPCRIYVIRSKLSLVLRLPLFGALADPLDHLRQLVLAELAGVFVFLYLYQ